MMAPSGGFLPAGSSTGGKGVSVSGLSPIHGFEEPDPARRLCRSSWIATLSFCSVRGQRSSNNRVFSTSKQRFAQSTSVPTQIKSEGISSFGILFLLTREKPLKIFRATLPISFCSSL
jgi:hypothetical protein